MYDTQMDKKCEWYSKSVMIKKPQWGTTSQPFRWPLERERSQMMARLWRNWNLYVVLKEIYSGATTMEVSQKLKIKLWYCCSEKEERGMSFSFPLLRTKKIKRRVSKPDHS